jgi:hypothetical protein
VDAAGDAGDPREGPTRVIEDTIQPFPTFSEIFLFAFEELARKHRTPAA